MGTLADEKEQDDGNHHGKEKGEAPSPSSFASTSTAPPLSTAAPAPTPAAAAPTAPAAAAAAAAPAPASQGAVEDAPVTATQTLSALLALKTKKTYEEIKPEVTIKALVGGKSALQNEIVGDLEAEFGGVPDTAAEMTVQELGATLQSGGYKPLGKVSSALVARLATGKMPGGFGLSALRSHLSSSWALGPGRTDAVLVHALPLAPKRRLKAEVEARAWLDGVAESYAKATGVSLTKGGNGGGGGGGSSGVGAAAMMQMMMAQASASGGGGGGGGGAPIPDVPATATQTLRALLALKTKKTYEEIKPEVTIKALVGGKSALQNEIVGDLEAEFGGVPDTAAEMTVQELGATLQSGGYKPLGKVSSALVARLATGKMPGGFGLSALRSHLSDKRLLGPGRVDAVLLHALPLAPAKRLSSSAEAVSWLDSCCESYGKAEGVVVPRAGAGGGVSGGAGGGGMSFAGMAAMVNGGGGGGGGGGLSGAERESLNTMLRDQLEGIQRYLLGAGHAGRSGKVSLCLCLFTVFLQYLFVSSFGFHQNYTDSLLLYHFFIYHLL